MARCLEVLIDSHKRRRMHGDVARFRGGTDTGGTDTGTPPPREKTPRGILSDARGVFVDV
jgi:hypothetical protein